MINNLPKLRIKLFFWFIIGSISTFFAEVISGSFLYPFFPFINAWGVISVIPLYTLHILVFSYIVYTFGKPRLHTLFFAGAIFGMYEAYATGVLWAGWSKDPMITIFGLKIIETIILVLVWHPLMSFIFPVIISETFLTKTKGSLQDLKFSKKFLVFLAIFFGFIQAFNISSPILAFKVGLTNIPIIIFLIFIWRKLNFNKYSMKELLPNRKQFTIIFILMIVQYILLSLLSKEKFPNITSQIFVWLIYLVLFFLFYISLKKSKMSKEKNQIINIKFSLKIITILSIIFILSSMIFSKLFISIKLFAWVLILGIYIIIGIGMLIYSLKKIFEK